MYFIFIPYLSIKMCFLVISIISLQMSKLNKKCLNLVLACGWNLKNILHIHIHIFLKKLIFPACLIFNFICVFICVPYSVNKKHIISSLYNGADILGQFKTISTHSGWTPFVLVPWGCRSKISQTKWSQGSGG